MAQPYFQPNYPHLQLVENEEYMIKDSDDIILAIKAELRKIKDKMDKIEQMDISNDEKDLALAKLIRQAQYLEVLSKKDKSELAELFLSAASGTNSIVPDVLQWYNPD